MKKSLSILLCLPFLLIAQTQQNNTGKLYFLESVLEHEAVWDTSYYGGDWNWLWEQDYAEFSGYNIATSTLTSQILDTSMVDGSNIGEGFDNPISCFDPTTNTLYALGRDGDDNNDTTYICALDVTTGNFTIFPIDIGMDDFDPWSGGTSPTHGDTSHSIQTAEVLMECWDNKLYFLESVYEHESVYDTTYFGWSMPWNWLWEHNHVKFSVYDIATTTLTSQILDTSIIEGFEGGAVSCFDPTTNMLYALGESLNNDTTYIGALDVTTGNLVLVPVDIDRGDFDPWNNGTSPVHGDTSHSIQTHEVIMGCWNNKLYFLESVHEHEAVWDTSYYGGDWNWLWEQDYTKFSEYDIATSTLTSQILDTSIVKGFGDELVISCFDPTTNTLYYLAEIHNDTTYIGALDVTNANIVLFPVDIGVDDFDDPWSGGTPPTHGDVSHSIQTHEVIMEVGYKLPGDSIMNITECDTYTWNGTTYTTTGAYTYTTTNAIGLDSVVTLDLIINSSTSSTDTHVACDDFMWNCDGNTYTASNNTATYVYTNAAGCDSTVTLDLTINSVSAYIDQVGDSLFAVDEIGAPLFANWYNIQTEDTTTRIWLMEENTASFSPTFECSYFIIVNDNGCIDTSSILDYAASSKRIGSFITSPNPTSGLINVKFENSKNQFVMFELISNNGSKLDEFITIENNLNIDLSKYPSGSYYLYFNSEDAVQGCRLEEVQKISTKIILNK